MPTSLQAVAQAYHKNNIPVFPVQVSLKNGKAEKLPLVREWQKVTVDSFSSLDFSTCNALGMPTGKASGLFVLDLDIGADLLNRPLPPTACQKTGSGGMHYFFKWHEGIGNRGAMEHKIDIRGEGGFVVIPPSWHPMGVYEWVIGLEEGVAEAPQWLLAKVQEKKKHDPNLAYGVTQGARNESAASVIGYILRNIDRRYWIDFGLAGLRAWNNRNTPPLPDDELVKIFKSIAAREYARRK